MAVKYSKQRDFGAKGRKTRKIGKKMWTLRSKHKLKSSAKRLAKYIRASKGYGNGGYNARVVKLTRGYGVYTHSR